MANVAFTPAEIKMLEKNGFNKMSKGYVRSVDVPDYSRGGVLIKKELVKDKPSFTLIQLTPEYKELGHKSDLKVAITVAFDKLAKYLDSERQKVVTLKKRTKDEMDETIKKYEQNVKEDDKAIKSYSVLLASLKIRK